MKKIYFLLIVSLFVSACSTTRTVRVTKENTVTNSDDLANRDALTVEAVPSNVQFRDDFTHIPEDAKETFLKKHKADADNYTMLFLTLGYKGEVVKVFSPNETIYNGTTYTLKSNGIAGFMRVLNTQDLFITDDYTKATVALDSKYLKKYKFVYVKKDNSNKKEPYTITYSNNLRPL